MKEPARGNRTICGDFLLSQREMVTGLFAHSLCIADEHNQQQTKANPLYSGRKPTVHLLLVDYWQLLDDGSNDKKCQPLPWGFYRGFLRLFQTSFQQESGIMAGVGRKFSVLVGWELRSKCPFFFALENKVPASVQILNFWTEAIVCFF